MNSRRAHFPVLGDKGARVPWGRVAPHEAQAQANHGQSLERLAARGGLSWAELYYVLTDQRSPHPGAGEVPLPDSHARGEVLSLLAP